MMQVMAGAIMRTILNLSCAAALLAGLTGPANAEWRIQSSHDRINDRDVKHAVVPAKAPDHGISANLEMICLERTGHMFSVAHSRPIVRGRGRIEGTYRVDEQAAVNQLLWVLSDPSRVSILGLDLVGAKRFRIESRPPGGPALFYDFDVSGTDKAVKAIACRNEK